MAEVSNVAEFCSLCLKAAERGNVAGALLALQSFSWRAGPARESSIGRVFSSRTLDDTCQAIGALQPTTPAVAERRGVVYIVSELRNTGGHSRVLSDIIQADTFTVESGEPVTILVTDVTNDHDPATADIFALLGAQMEIAPKANYARRMGWLKHRLATLSPRVTRLALHPWDTVGIAAAQPELVGELVFLHNSDHSLTLGVTLEHALHVDFHAKGFYNCCDREGVPNNVMWPLTAEDLGPRSPIYSGRALRTCTSGGIEKFQPQFTNDMPPYAYRYEDVVPLIPAATGGMHVHIGPLPDVILDAIAAGLDKLGVARERFVHVPRVPSLWEALKTLEIDLYLTSFPRGGGRAAVEAQGAGLPICVHANYRSIFLSDVNLVYEEALVWRTPEEMVACLSGLTPETLGRHSVMARRHYEENHHPALLRSAVAGQTMTPARPRHDEDWLQTYIDQTGPVHMP